MTTDLHYEQKLVRLLRYHRQRVFDPQQGDRHHRAILRLKRTVTARAVFARTAADAARRYSERLLSTYA